MKKRCFALVCFIAIFIALPVQAEANGIDVNNAISQTIAYEQSLFPNPQPSCGYAAGAEWAWTGDMPAPDLTAMVLQALAPYDTDAHPAVVDAVVRGLSVLSAMQLADGGFSSYGAENACSVAQVVTALCELGIDPTSQVCGFNQGDANMVENLLSFGLPSGGFIYQQGEGAASAFSSEQALYALVGYQRLEEGKSSLY